MSNFVLTERDHCSLFHVATTSTRSTAVSGVEVSAATSRPRCSASVLRPLVKPSPSPLPRSSKLSAVISTRCRVCWCKGTRALPFSISKGGFGHQLHVAELLGYVILCAMLCYTCFWLPTPYHNLLSIEVTPSDADIRRGGVFLQCFA